MPAVATEPVLVKYPNPPLDQIKAEDLITAADAAAQFGVNVDTIYAWVARRKVEPAIKSAGRMPALFHFPTLCAAEKDAYRHGADRPNRGGRHPDWKPCTAVPEPHPAPRAA